MGALTDLTMAGALAGLAKGEFSSRELTDAHLQAMEKHRGLNAFVTETPDRARAMADASDKRRREGQIGAMEGLPIGIKDLFCTEGVATMAGSHILEGFKPAYESTVTANLWRAGAVMLGKMNLDEFAMGSSNLTSYHGPVENPWKRKGDNAKLVPGGSSGGSGAAVAARLAIAATGTDTGGSIRQPAAFCGIVGLKPTYGRCSRWGIVAFASSLDQAGPMGRSAEDLALLLNTMAGYDERDSTSLQRDKEDYARDLARPLQGLKIGLPREYFATGLSAGVARVVEAALAEYRRLGAETVEISLPNTRLSIPVYYVLAPAEASSNLARYDGVRYGYRAPQYGDLTDMYQKTRAQGFGPEVKRRIMIGTYVLSAGYYDAYYIKAQKLRRLIARDFAQAFRQCDVIMGPTSPTTAFKLGEKSDDPVSMYLSDIYTIAVNLAGLPGMSISCGFGAAGMPVGLQLIGPWFGEAKMLNVAHQYQLVTDWHTRMPGGLA